MVNAGSSSLKFCVFQRPAGDAWLVEARGQIEGIGVSPRLSVKDANGALLANQDVAVRDSREAIHASAVWLSSRYGGSRVVGVGHRVVHGGAHFAGPTIVNPKSPDGTSRVDSTGPLHQPHNLAAIEAVSERLPDVPQVACFDTSFHRGQPAVAELVPLPHDLRQAGLQRYGFHGLSYEYIASVLPQVAPEIANGRVIVAHLGSGASLCALRGGKSVDCTLASLRLMVSVWDHPGTLDPGVVLYLFQRPEALGERSRNVLYKKSGLLGISGISSDMRDLLGRAEPEARLAVDYFVYRAAKEIGALAAVLGGVDALVFTAGIGENSPRSASGSAKRRHGWASNSIPRPMPERSADLDTPQQSIRVGDSDQRGTHDRPATANAA